MYLKLVIGAALAASISTVSAQACAEGSAQQLGGNWYCSAVDSIAYTNFGSSGSYNEITDMNGGKCSSKKKEFSGPLAPLDGEVSWHFRGPLQLKKFAYYTLGSAGKRDAKPSFHARRHGHGHMHRKAEEKRGVGDVVTATINGEVVTWVNQYQGGAAPTPNPGSGSPPKSGPKGDNRKQSSPVNAGVGKWGRQGYYDAEKGVADGLTFLNHKGGQGSGVFDTTFGNSLSYASDDGLNGAASPCVLKNVLIPDNNEIIIMSDKECKGDSCGAVRPGTVAYHGFGGASKLFLLELSMPLSGKTGFNMDMPAAWILNAAIPRTLQYGKAECSCWSSGCGEFDVIEVLDSGNTKAKSTLHANISGGDSNYFKRPTDKPIKVAVVFNSLSSSAHIKILDDNVDFSPVMDSADVAKFCLDASLNSIFHLGA
ncbi:target of Sbf [Emydomyces testavorans]|uniref:glucan endo-1,3-beta-D-glucosidase n=1 Tax=Emydomyces testavorans TaxID=2070801 RepID=A0AAF0IJA8_9EURO|nr:target of Sbf [Emydomyces testavorans]